MSRIVNYLFLAFSDILESFLYSTVLQLIAYPTCFLEYSVPFPQYKAYFDFQMSI
jgi:hypothetical protein